MLSVKKLL